MSDNALRKAIEEVVNEVLKNKNEIKIDIPTFNANTDIFMPKFGLKDNWSFKPVDNLIVKDISMQEEMKAAAKLALKDNGLVNKIEFYDVPSPERVLKVEDGDLKISCDGIKVNHGKGNITFNHEGLSFDFGVALEYIKKGVKVCRRGWNGKGMWLKMIGSYNILDLYGDSVHQDQHSAFIGIKSANGMFGPWTPSQEDILANDWTIYIGE